MENNNSKTVGGFTFNLDSVFNKFSQAVTNQQSESESRPLSGNSGYIGGSAVSNPPRPSAEGSDRTREQRLQAIKETAKHLQEKIQNEARKLKGEVVDDGKFSQLPLKSEGDCFLTISYQYYCYQIYCSWTTVTAFHRKVPTTCNCPFSRINTKVSF